MIIGNKGPPSKTAPPQKKNPRVNRLVVLEKKLNEIK